MLIRLFLSFVLCAYGHSFLMAQLALSDDFAALLEQGQLDFFTPVEDQFKVKKSIPNELLTPDLVLRKKKSSLEIRYAIFPHSDGPLEQIPQVRCLTTAMSLATNEGESVLSVHQLHQAHLDQLFQADWGGVVYFQPKGSFSKKRHCKLLALQAAGKALVFVFFLFDEVTEELPEELASIQFRK